MHGGANLRTCLSIEAKLGVIQELTAYLGTLCNYESPVPESKT